MRRFIIILLALPILAIGCGKSDEERAEERAEKAIEEQTGGEADVSIKDDKISIESQEGSFEISQGTKLEMPKDFPDDVFVLDDPQISVSSSNNELQSLVYTSKLDEARAVDDYKKEMADKGWESESSIQTPQGTMLAFKKGDTRSVMVSISKQDDATQVTLMVENQRP